jgi:hypothetical protein
MTTQGEKMRREGLEKRTRKIINQGKYKIVPVLK